MLKEYKNSPYPQNLWSVVLDKRVSADELPIDWEPALNHVLGGLKTEKDKEILIHYFKDGMSLSEVGSLYGVTTERIRQQMNAAIRRLRHPVRNAFFLYGWEGGLVAAEKIVTERERWDKGRLGDLGLGVRAYNCLMRAGVDTIDKLLQYCEWDLRRIRGMGEINVAEVKGKLARHGLSLRELCKEE